MLSSLGLVWRDIAPCSFICCDATEVYLASPRSGKGCRNASRSFIFRVSLRSDFYGLQRQMVLWKISALYPALRSSLWDFYFWKEISLNHFLPQRRSVFSFIPDSSLGIVLPHQIANQKGEGNFDGINRNIFAPKAFGVRNGFISDFLRATVPMESGMALLWSWFLKHFNRELRKKGKNNPDFMLSLLKFYFP